MAFGSFLMPIGLATRVLGTMSAASRYLREYTCEAKEEGQQRLEEVIVGVLGAGQNHPAFEGQSKVHHVGAIG